MNKQKDDLANSGDLPAISLSNSRRLMCFIIMYFLYMMDVTLRSGVNVIFPFIQKDLMLTDVQVGILGTVLALTIAAFVLPLSFLGSKYSSKKAITACASIWTVGSLIAGRINSFGVLLAARFTQGLGCSSYSSLSNGMLTSMYPKKKWGKQVGIYNTAQTVAIAAASMLFGKIAESSGWRTAFYILAGLNLFGALLSLLLPDTKEMQKTEAKKEEQPAKEKKLSFLEAMKVILGNKALIGVCLSAGIVNMLVLAVLSWQSFFYMREMNLPVETASIYITTSAIVSAVGFLVGGILVDKWYQRDKRGRVFLPAVFIIIAMLTLAAGFMLAKPVLIFAGSFCVAGALTTFHVTAQELVPVYFKSVSYGALTLFIQGIGALGPILTGTLSAKFGLVNALAGIQLAALIPIILLLLVGKVYIKAFNRARELETVK